MKFWLHSPVVLPNTRPSVNPYGLEVVTNGNVPITEHQVFRNTSQEVSSSSSLSPTRGSHLASNWGRYQGRELPTLLAYMEKHVIRGKASGRHGSPEMLTRDVPRIK